MWKELIADLVKMGAKLAFDLSLQNELVPRATVEGKISILNLDFVFPLNVHTGS